MILTGRLADGRICSGSDDGHIKIWNLESGICEVTLTGHTSSVNVIIQLRDNRRCSASSGSNIMIWNIASYSCEITLIDHTGYVLTLVELLDGRLYYSIMEY